MFFKGLQVEKHRYSSQLFEISLIVNSVWVAKQKFACYSLIFNQIINRSNRLYSSLKFGTDWFGLRYS